jgi:flagellar hook assembly protein FlgD
VTYDGLANPKTTSVNVTMATAYTVHVGVYNEAGELVKEVWVQQLSQEILSFNLFSQPTITSLHGQVYIEYQGQQIATWDGTNSTGDPVTNGKYYVKVDNVDSLGVVTSVSQLVMVSRSIARITVNIYNEAGEIVRHLYSYADDPNNNPLSNVQLSTSVIKPSETSGSNSTVAITSTNGMTLVWDGKSDSGAIVTNGHYQVEVHYTDGKGGEQVITEGVVVQSANAAITNGNVFAGPNVLKNGVNTTLVQVYANWSYTLTARLYNTAGELVKPAVTGQPGANKVPLDVSGVASGLYFVVVDMTNAQGGIAGHQVTQIVIQH